MNGKWNSYPDPLGMKAGTRMEYVPKHMASLWGIYTVQDGPLGGLSFGAGVRYVGSNSDIAPILSIGPGGVTEVGVNATKAPAFTLFDAMVAYETTDWRWQLTAHQPGG